MSGPVNRSGFSIVEIIIVVGMMAVLSTITMINFKGNSIEERVQAGANTLQSTMTLARTYARTGKVCCGDKSPNGYGVVFNTAVSPQTIILYGNIDSNFDYNAGTDLIVATNPIDQQVELNSAITDILFMTGTTGQVTMNGADWAINGSSTMIIQEKKLPHTVNKTVTLHYPGGLIDQP